MKGSSGRSWKRKGKAESWFLGYSGPDMCLPPFTHFLPPQSPSCGWVHRSLGQRCSSPLLHPGQDGAGPKRGVTGSQVVPKNITACFPLFSHVTSLFLCDILGFSNTVLSKRKMGSRYPQSRERPVSTWPIHCNSMPPTLCPQGPIQDLAGLLWAAVHKICCALPLWPHWTISVHHSLSW